MHRKPKFKPVITRIKLDPEQAVLTCTCFEGVHPVEWSGISPSSEFFTACIPGARSTSRWFGLCYDPDFERAPSSCYYIGENVGAS